MSHVLIVGQKFSTLTEYLLAHGHTYTLLQDARKTKYPDKKFKHRVVTGFDDMTEVIGHVDRLKKRPDAVIATYENYILAAAKIADHLGLPGMPIDAAMRCTDKELMRQAFMKAPEKISPAFEVVQSENDVREFASKHSFPLILKPANLAKSLLVTKNHSLEELVANYRKSVDLLESTYKKYASGRTPKLIIEEFLEGKVYSVDAFVDADGTPHVLKNIVDYQTGYDIGFDDNFHYSRILPSELSDDNQRALLHCADIGARALGMKSSPAHIEIIMTVGGPRIVEIGARNGGYRERMHQMANGIDITGAALATALGKTPNIESKKSDNVAVLELFPKKAGEYIGIENEDKLRNLSSLNYLSIKARPGAFIGKSADGYKMAAVVILHNSNDEQFTKDLDFVTNNCHVQTK